MSAAVTVVKGCAKSALLSLVGLLAAAAVVSAGLYRWSGITFTDSAGIALIAGFLLWVSVNLLRAAVTAWRERAALSAGLAGTTPQDGRATILSGRIEPIGQTLRSPLSGRDCVAYTFEISATRGSGRRQRRVVYCDGIAVTPSTIVTPAGSFRLLAVPELDCDECLLDPAESMTRAAEVMRSTPYEPPPASFSRRPAIEQQWNDEDGEFRRERRRVEQDVALAECQLSERVLERGAPVCVFGYYSAAKRAIVADPSDWSKVTRIMKGSAQGIAGQLGSSIVRRAVGALVFAGLAAGAIAAFVASSA